MKEALKLALEALENATHFIEEYAANEYIFAHLSTIKDLRQAIALQEGLVEQSQRQPWVGLTDDDKQIAFDDTQEGGGFWEFADAIESTLRKKNHG